MSSAPKKPNVLQVFVPVVIILLVLVLALTLSKEEEIRYPTPAERLQTAIDLQNGKDVIGTRVQTANMLRFDSDKEIIYPKFVFPSNHWLPADEVEWFKSAFPQCTFAKDEYFNMAYNPDTDSVYPYMSTDNLAALRNTGMNAIPQKYSDSNWVPLSAIPSCPQGESLALSQMISTGRPRVWTVRNGGVTAHAMTTSAGSVKMCVYK
eukprot:jgi/Mesvir1/12681/Mv01680-RA.1